MRIDMVFPSDQGYISLVPRWGYGLYITQNLHKQMPPGY